MSVATKSSATVAAIMVAAALGTIVLFVKPPGQDDVCIAPGCKNAAARILNAMDTSADPCEDFFQYACGGWIDAHPIPDDRSNFEVLDLVSSVNTEKLRDALDSDDTGDRDAIKKMKRFFKSCMDEEAIEELGAQPTLDFIHRLGGMPLFGDAFDERNFSLENALSKSSTSVIVKAGLWPPMDENSSMATITMDKANLGMLSTEAYILPHLNTTLSAYRKYMEDILTDLWKSKDEINGGDTTYNQTTLKSAVDEIIRLEIDLATILQASKWGYDEFTLEGMYKDVSAEFDWYEFAKKVMSTVDYDVTPTNEVVSSATEYFTKSMPVVKKYDNRTLMNYIVWMNIERNVEHMPKRFRETAATISKVTRRSPSTGVPRLTTCMNSVKLHFNLPLASIFVEKHFSRESKLQVKEMFDNVVEYFRKNLPKLGWMDDGTKKTALLKLESTALYLAYPDYIIEEEDPTLDKDLESLTIPENDYYTSQINLGYLYERNQKRTTKTPANILGWTINPPISTTATYTYHRNVMIVPAGRMQAPYFDEHQPFAMNYGGIGSEIGHQLTHGFDRGGSRFNENGNFENWWSNMSKKHFDEKAQCVRDQYSRFYYDLAEMFVNGNLTVDENIADLAGIRFAYGAYKRWQKNSGKNDFKLPRLEQFSQEQLFFLSFGQSLCGSETQDKAQDLLKRNEYSPSMFRVNGALKNFKKFGKAFGCTKGEDKLFPDPENKCRVF